MGSAVKEGAGTSQRSMFFEFQLFLLRVSPRFQRVASISGTTLREIVKRELVGTLRVVEGW